MEDVYPQAIAFTETNTNPSRSTHLLIRISSWYRKISSRDAAYVERALRSLLFNSEASRMYTITIPPVMKGWPEPDVESDVGDVPVVKEYPERVVVKNPVLGEFARWTDGWAP